MALSVIGVLLGVLGFGVLIWHAPWVALGVFLCIWGNNIGFNKPK